jgi:hypothetical protein
MRVPRNPFHLRTAQHAREADEFLSLFAPGILEILDPAAIWDRVHLIQSSPGGGKTSLLRAFEPESLLRVHAGRRDPQYRDLADKMSSMGALTAAGPNVLGIYLPCARNYGLLQHVGFLDDGQRQRLLFSLLNARIVMAALHAALLLHRLQATDLEQVSVQAELSAALPGSFPRDARGKELFEWAAALETSVCNALDSLTALDEDQLPGHDSLYALEMVRPGVILVRDQPVAQRTLVMFDDVHSLAASQRAALLAMLGDMRPAVGVWIAERLDALGPQEFLAHGITEKREISVLNLEAHWRKDRASHGFRAFVEDVAHRRTASADDPRLRDLATRLPDAAAHISSQVQAKQPGIRDEIKARLQEMTQGTARYNAWVEAVGRDDMTPRDELVALRQLEILVERDRRRQQLTMDLDPLDPNELGVRSSNDTQRAAEYLLCLENSLPYYCGMNTLSILASRNVEQFLEAAGDLYEEISAAIVSRKDGVLLPERQDAILTEWAARKWLEIPRRIPAGRDVQRLLEAIGLSARFAARKQRNAPYAPGITGIGLTCLDRDRLRDAVMTGSHELLGRLARAISSCVALNLLEAIPDAKQGAKGETKMVLYLNRWLCIHFRLPYGYGGWRTVTPERLVQVLDTGTLGEKRLFI